MRDKRTPKEVCREASLFPRLSPFVTPSTGIWVLEQAEIAASVDQRTDLKAPHSCVCVCVFLRSIDTICNTYNQ